MYTSIICINLPELSPVTLKFFTYVNFIVEKRRRRRIKVKSKKYLWILFVLTLLTSMLMVNVPVTASPTVTYSIDPYITSGVAPDNDVSVNVTIDTSANITGARIWVEIDPAVLTPGYEIFPGVTLYVTEGNFLSDWADTYNETGWEPGIAPIQYTLESDGYADISLFIKTYNALPDGHGASGNGTLVTLWFTSLSQTAHSLIDITTAQYGTPPPDAALFSVDIIYDGHYNQPPGATLRLYSESSIVTKGIELTNHTLSHASDDSWYNISAFKQGQFYQINVEMIYSTSVDPAILSQILVFSEAHVQDASNPVAINIYNYNTSLWELAFNVDATTDTDYNYTITTNLANYVDATTDEMKLQVSYNVKNAQSIFHQDHTYIELTTPEVGWIAGTVTDESTGLPIEGVNVTADGYSNITDAGGSYSIELPPGTYNVTASADGYLNETQTGIVVSSVTW